jgi:hypothetical protein
MSTTTSTPVEQPSAARPRSRVRRPRLIRQASAWLPGRAPEPLPLQDLEESNAIRWVDIYGGDLDGGEVLALLSPICRGALKHRMVRDLITPERFASGGRYGDSPVAISSAFRIRHLQPGTDEGAPVGADGVTSVFEPVQLLVGDDWLLSCWLPPRVFRGLGDPVDATEDSSNGLYLAVSKRWVTSGSDSAEDLASLARRQLAAANGYRTPIN